MSLASVFSDIANSLKNKVYIGQGYKYSSPQQMTTINYKPTQIASSLNNLSIIEEQGFDIDNNLPVAGLMYSSTIGKKPEITSYAKEYRYESYTNMGTTYNEQVDCDTVYVGLSDANNLFREKTTFNKKVIFSNNTTNIFSVFYNCYNFNQPINIPDNATDMSRAFQNCYNFNQPITIGNSIINMYYTFFNCQNFNQPIAIPNNVTDMYSTFRKCYNFNQSITIPDSVNNMIGTFWSCYSFNQLIDIPNNIDVLDHVYSDCYNFNQPIYIPNNIINVGSIVKNCPNFENNIYFSSVNNLIYCNNMFANCNNSKRKNIYCSDYTPFLQYNDTNSIVGADITWTDMDNGVYNSAYNIYIYNNYISS